MQKTGSRNRMAVKEMLKVQRPKVLLKIKEAQKEINRLKSEHEKKMLARAKAIGKCPMGFEVRERWRWLGRGGGIESKGEGEMVRAGWRDRVRGREG